MTSLFDPLQLRGITIPNRIGMSPMCMYSYADGLVTTFQAIHQASRAVGGVGLIIAEATAVEPIGRITPYDAGIWNDEQAVRLGISVQAVRESGAVAGIQLAHAGRKASTDRPWTGGKPISPEQPMGWQPIGPSAVAFADGYSIPAAMSIDDIQRVILAFSQAAKRAITAGYQFIEIHAAHGYLIHSFLSPLSNFRDDQYGGSFENRMRFLLEIVDGIRTVIPDSIPLCVRLSGTDWDANGWTVENSVDLSVSLKAHGVDMIDCSSGGIISTIRIPVGPGYQVPIAERIRKESNIPTAAVGLITDPLQANNIIQSEQADLVLLGRRLLSEPYWPQTAAKVLGYEGVVPNQYLRGH